MTVVGIVRVDSGAMPRWSAEVHYDSRGLQLGKPQRASRAEAAQGPAATATASAEASSQGRLEEPGLLPAWFVADWHRIDATFLGMTRMELVHALEVLCGAHGSSLGATASSLLQGPH